MLITTEIDVSLRFFFFFFKKKKVFTMEENGANS